ncbi:hypothetical protein SERLA73DRAFT_188544 [Serpula lacrymans var. lacrymans S7.3]|uniref:NAD(P)-binding protein n=2 Tax=Serpula lacrymans var. lacrymans TaxID=341189 RepID=F8QBI7_SERL3|nr:uncharacterized protein SERLADRAFT_478684 [Serpula lacrymans var. lacrymans S7.9]EGN94573.1 hypothetical protein SERLA73DRAFT_188544 [Serpula lacrymans var. lacrymans S7.3]EGO20050.1 hypothetical protein SERLADRAFT_478684 [Serpula lacrymans var. lacrymans S7.9]
MHIPKVWLITGTSSGFGRRLAAEVISRGDRVIATARSLGNLQDLTEGPDLRLHQLDVSSGSKAVKCRIDEAAAIWGGIDVVVNNAGVGLPGLLEEAGSEHMMQQYKTNVFGVLDVTNAALPYMRKNRSGTIVIVGSRSAWKTEVRGLGFYASSKAAVQAMGETLALELTPLNIRVLIVEPGAFRTEKIYAYPFHTDNPIPDYDEQREDGVVNFGAVAGKQKGDPTKAMKALVDVVNGEGCASGKPWPLYLVLGEDAEQDIRDKCKKVMDHLDEWRSVVRGTNFD